MDSEPINSIGEVHVQGSRSTKHSTLPILATLAIVALLAVTFWTTGTGGRGTALAQEVPFDCSGLVQNGGFENGTPGGTADSWGGSYDLWSNSDQAHDGQHLVTLYSYLGSVLTQTLNTSALQEGDTLTISVWSDRPVTIALGESSATPPFSTPYSWRESSFSFTLEEEIATLDLAISAAPNFIPSVDTVTSSCSRLAPTETPTLTPTNTMTPSPTNTPTMTPSPTATNTPSPSPTATTTSTPDPTATTTPSPTEAPAAIPDTMVRVTGDPRFPILESAAIPGYDDLTYTLDTPPAIGDVIVEPDGSFTYAAPATMATGDQFTVLATAPDGETALVTVIITFEVDKTIPTYGKVGPGGTGYGGDITDARSPADPGSLNDPDPTSTPSGGRTQRP